MKKILVFVLFLIFSFSSLFAGTELKSYEEEYYDFLVLSGRAERYYLNYRTLSNNRYSNEYGVWDDYYLYNERPISEDSSYTLYGPDFFASYNTDRPYGQNDGALWQGVGFNGQIKAGINYTYKGLSLTVKPEIDFSQNKEYTTVNNTNNYFWSQACFDLPQRFGDKSFFTFDFGDSEIRYTANSFTVGVGTQALWLGPTYINSILHSNNAATYPRLDIGFTKTPLFKIGNVELMYSLGLLTKSKYSTLSNKHTLLHLFSVSYNPSFVPDLVLGFNYVCHTEATWKGCGQALTSLFTRSNSSEDAKMSFTFDWLFPKVGFEVYGECAFDDYTTDVVARCFHTIAGQLGLKKAFTLNEQKNLYGELFAELGIMSLSRDYFADSHHYNPNFYSHGTNPGSYTNMGQLIGCGTGWGGNSQYLGFNFIYPKGLTKVFIQRSNPDNNYVYFLANQGGGKVDYLYKFKGILTFGADSAYFIGNNLQLSLGASYSVISNDAYENTKDYKISGNFNARIGGKIFY